MTPERLLDAIGLLDDDLIQEAEQAPASRKRRGGQSGRWFALAASLALVLGLGYGAVRLGLVSGMKGGGASLENASGGAMAPAGSGPSVSLDAEMGDGCTGESPEVLEPDMPAAPEELPEPDPLPTGFIQLSLDQSGTYLLTGADSELPEGAVQVGNLKEYTPEGPVPSTDVAAYVGLELWAAEDRTALYVALSDGQYAVAELVEP